MKEFFFLIKTLCFLIIQHRGVFFYIYIDYDAGRLRQQMGNLASYFDYIIRNRKIKLLVLIGPKA